jgi:hypothetical protein
VDGSMESVSTYMSKAGGASVGFLYVQRERSAPR